MMAKSEIQLTSDLVALRVLTIDDVSERYVSWMNDQEINQYLESRYTAHDLSSVQSFVAAMYASEDDYLFGIYYREKHVGNIKLGSLSKYYLRADIGLLLGERDCWGKGIATVAIQLVTEWAFQKLKLKRVEAGCYSDNIGSRRAFEKSGFTVEAVLKNRFRLDSGEWQDQVFMAKENSEVE